MALDLFAQVAAAKAGSGARYPYLNTLPLGDYEAQIEVLKRIEGVQDGLVKVITEVQITKSSDPSVKVGARYQEVKIPQKNPKAMPMVLAEIKEMAAAACLTDVNDLTKEDIEEAFSSENPTRGVHVGIRVYEKTSGFKKVEFRTVEQPAQ